jgi:hypothetical protein
MAAERPSPRCTEPQGYRDLEMSFEIKQGDWIEVLRTMPSVEPSSS